MTTPSQIEAYLSEAIRSLAVEYGVVSSPVQVGGNTLSDGTKRWATNIHRNSLVRILKGMGAGQAALVSGNSDGTLIIYTTWQGAIAPGDIYVIVSRREYNEIIDALGGGAPISAANPLPVDFSPGQKTSLQIIALANLAGGATSTLADCVALDLRNGPASLALTVAATYNAAATRGLRFHVRTSADNVNWDTEDFDAWDAGFTAGATIRETEIYDTDSMYLRVLIENLDAAQIITNLGVLASVGA